MESEISSIKKLTLDEVEFVAGGLDCSWRGYVGAFQQGFFGHGLEGLDG